MKCTSPLHAVWYGKYTESGAKKYTILTQSDKTDKNLIGDYEHFDINCGHCLACRLNKSKEWSIRCMQEASYYDHNYFVTLTYENSPLDLVKEDLKLFIKKLRNFFYNKYNESGIRYFACGEYGSSTLRPHYHIILFNCNIRDLVLINYDPKTNSYHYDSSTIRNIWNKGLIDIGEVTPESCSYVARYTSKKATSYNILQKYSKSTVPEFVVMSNHPGIGYSYYMDHKYDIYNNDSVLFEHVNRKPP